MNNVFKLQEIKHENYQFSKLLVYCNCFCEVSSNAVSINKLLSLELSKWESNKRTINLENALIEVIKNLDDNPIIKDFDVLLNPLYKIDLIKLFISVNKKIPFDVIWGGEFNNNKLIYAEEGFVDYKTFDISNYDIICII